MSTGLPPALVGVATATALLAAASLVAEGRSGLAARRCRLRLGALGRSSPVGPAAQGAGLVGAAVGRRARRRPPVPGAVVRAVHDLAVAATPETVWAAWLAATGAAGVVGLVVGGGLLAMAAIAAVVAAPVLVAVGGRGRRARLVDRQLPVALDRLARAVQAGSSLATAFAAVGDDAPEPLAGELRALEADLLAGERLSTALRPWSERCATPGVRLVVAATTLGHDAGGAQARALDGVASTLRERQAVHREARALASQARASAAVIVLAPLGFAVFSAATDPAVLGFLLGTPLGVACLVAALLLDAVGAVWMARLTRGAG